MKNEKLILKITPQIDGLCFRKFAGESDYPGMVAILDAVAKADKQDHAITLDDLRHDYAHLTNSDPYQDMVLAEIHGELVAYSRVEWWQEEEPNHRIYSHFCNILPKWRNKGIETAMFDWNETRLKKIAAEHPQDSQRFFQTYSSEHKADLNKILEVLDYEPARYFISMSRLLEDIPTAELPEGIEVRPVNLPEARKVWDAANDAFRDHWGFSPPKEEHFVSYQESKYFQPDLWQVAFDGDEVVSSVMNYIEHDYNQKFNKKRGWTENISTRREWRRRGIAKALIVRSMHMHKAKGMTEVALGVDTNNPNGALKLYQSLGYKKDQTMITYRKKI